MSSETNSKPSFTKPTEQQIQRAIEAAIASFEKEKEALLEQELDYEPELHAYVCPCCGQAGVEWNEAFKLYSCSDCGLITKGSF